MSFNHICMASDSAGCLVNRQLDFVVECVVIVRRDVRVERLVTQPGCW